MTRAELERRLELARRLYREQRSEIARLRAALAEQLEIDDDPRLKHHRNGPATEAEAVAFTLPRVGSLRWEILRWLERGPSSPTPFIEATGHNETSVRPRFTELKRAGWIIATGERAITRNRAEEEIHRLTLAGWELLDREEPDG